jgi:hypothetical protein
MWVAKVLAEKRGMEIGLLEKRVMKIWLAHKRARKYGFPSQFGEDKKSARS